MFEQFSLAPPDPILGLAARVAADRRPGVLDLTSGVYKDATGLVAKFAAVAEAEQRYLASEHTKAYLPIDGSPAFAAAVGSLLFADQAEALERTRTTHTPGGTGGLALAAHLLAQVVGPRRVWVSRPTWPNHAPVFTRAGHQVADYRYYRSADRALDAEAMLADLEAVGSGEVVLVHGCCHNPTGRDLTPELWAAVLSLVAERGALLFVDQAYLGMAEGFEDDCAYLGPLLDAGVEAFLTTSFSKNMGLYRERVGALTVVAGDGPTAEAVQSNVKVAVRTLWSNPPSFGAAVAATVVDTPDLRASWLDELAALRDRLNGLRAQLATTLVATGLDGYEGVASERGMFTLTGLSVRQVEWLASERGIYLVGSGRANVAGLTPDTIPTLVAGIADALAQPDT